MQGLATDNAPSPGVVVPHFIFASISFFVVVVLMLLSASSFTGYFFEPHLLAITHAAVLGFGTMIIFGALYQLIPVIFETALYSEKLAKVTFWTFGIAVVMMVYTFWNNQFSTLLVYSASLTFIALMMFLFNIVASTRRATKKTFLSNFITFATYWLGLTALIALIIALNYKFNFLNQSHLLYLKMHAHMGMAGWFLLLVMGAAATLIPMFLVSHQMNENKLKYAFYFVNAGLFLLESDWLFLHGSVMLPVWGLMIGAGIFFFLSYVRESYKKRLRKNLDVGMKHTMIAVLFMILPVFLGIIASISGLNFDQKIYWRIIMLYGFSIIFFFITSIILGQTYKTIPFIIWLVKYKSFVGKTKTPLPKDLYSEKIADIQLYSYIASIPFLLGGILAGSEITFNIGAALLLITAILYNMNVFKIVFHKSRIETKL